MKNEKVLEFLLAITLKSTDKRINAKYLEMLEAISLNLLVDVDASIRMVRSFIKETPELKWAFNINQYYLMKRQPGFIELYSTHGMVNYLKVARALEGKQMNILIIRLLTGGIYRESNTPSVIGMGYVLLESSTKSVLLQGERYNLISTKGGIECGVGSTCADVPKTTLTDEQLAAGVADDRTIIDKYVRNAYPASLVCRPLETFNTAIVTLMDELDKALGDSDSVIQLVGTGMEMTCKYLMDEPAGRALLKRALMLRVDLSHIGGLLNHTDSSNVIDDLTYARELVPLEQPLSAAKEDAKFISTLLTKKRK